MIQVRISTAFREKLEKRCAARGPQNLSRNTDGAACEQDPARALLRENRQGPPPWLLPRLHRRYVAYPALPGDGVYDSEALGTADDTLEADGIKVLDYWQAQEAAKRWAERERLIEAGVVRSGPYSVADAIRDYLEEIRTEKKSDAVRDAEYRFNAFVLPELGKLSCEALTRDRLLKWRNTQASRPKRVRSKPDAAEPAPSQRRTTTTPEGSGRSPPTAS